MMADFSMRYRTIKPVVLWYMYQEPREGSIRIASEAHAYQVMRSAMKKIERDLARIGKHDGYTYQHREGIINYMTLCAIRPGAYYKYIKHCYATRVSDHGGTKKTIQRIATTLVIMEDRRG